MTKRGFSLAELIVVTTIIGLLVMAIMPALRASIKAAKQTTDITRLHQIAVACAMYDGDSSGLPPSVPQLIAAVPSVKNVLSFEKDPFKDGVYATENRFRAERPLDFRVSFLTLQDSMLTGLVRKEGRLHEATNDGGNALAIAPIGEIMRGVSGDILFEQTQGKYLRVTESGAVLFRDVQADLKRFPQPFETGPSYPSCDRRILLYVNPSAEEFGQHCRKIAGVVP